MNNQVESSLRVLLAAIGPSVAALLVALGVAHDTAGAIVTAVIGVLPPVAAAVWGIIQNSDKNVIAAASKIEGVAKIKVDPRTENTGAVEAAHDPTLPNVKTH